MKNYALYLIEECYGGKLLEMNGEPDHVHLLFELPPALSPSTVICNLKTQLSKGVRKRYWGKIQPLLWKDSFWSDSYFLTTTGGANIETLEQYIQQQGIEKPKKKICKKKITRIHPHPISSDGVFCYERIKRMMYLHQRKRDSIVESLFIKNITSYETLFDFCSYDSFS